MEVSHYNLSGGIDSSLTKTELGLITKTIYWTDSENVEIYQNRGITRQNGNTLFLDLEIDAEITGLHEMNGADRSKLVITASNGDVYMYDDVLENLVQLDKILTGVTPNFLNFLTGTAVMTESDGLFYIKEDDDSDTGYEVIDCGLLDDDGEAVVGGVMEVFNSRIFVGAKSTIYYSALGMYDDFTTDGDAGYIRNFRTDTANITALKTYKDYLAIYKQKKVFLLSGLTEDDFVIESFADKGAYSDGAITNVDNKQLFLSNGIYALEHSGELDQIYLGSEVTLKIKSLFQSMTTSLLNKSFCVHYQQKNQVWFFFPMIDDEYFHTIWIYEYINKSWYKRVVPQNLTCATLYNEVILSGDSTGKIFKEDNGNTFNGEPISFMWKSPFLSITKPEQRKTIDEFYFVLDNEYDNDFYLKVYKNYDSNFSDDPEHVQAIIEEHLSWGDDNDESELPYEYWGADDATTPIWSINTETMEKAEISEANYSIQICVEGYDATNNCTIIGLHFKEIYVDD